MLKCKAGMDLTCDDCTGFIPAKSEIWWTGDKIICKKCQEKRKKERIQ
jgi:hypothetical protein